MRPLALILLWGLVYLPSLGLQEIAFDEHKRILPAIGMMESSNWVLPELAGEDYFKKPPLINWMIASSFIAFGERSELAARLPSALAVLSFALLLLLLKPPFLNRDSGFVAALLFVTSASVIMKGRQAEIEAAYTSITGASICVWISLRSLSKKNLAYLFAFILLGFGLLLKGPMILLFFYAVAISVLASEKSLKELLSPRHFLGIALMLAIFLAWALEAHEAKKAADQLLGNSAPAAEQAGIVKTWIKELKLRFVDNMNPLKWAGNVLSALCSFAPWIILAPLMWSKEKLSMIPEKDRPFFRACRNGIVIAFCLVCLMPGTRARYSMPAISFVCLLLGWLLSCQPPDSCTSIQKYWKKILSILFPTLAVAFAIGAIAAAIIFILKNFDGFLSAFNSWKILLLALAACAIANFANILWLKTRKCPEIGILRLVFFSALLTACVSLFYSTILLPPISVESPYRRIGAAIRQNVSESDRLYAHKVGSEHFLFYLDNQPKHLKKLRDLPDDAVYYLIEKDEYDENKIYPFFTTREPQTLAELKSDKRSFYLLKFGQKYENKAGK